MVETLTRPDTQELNVTVLSFPAEQRIKASKIASKTKQMLFKHMSSVVSEPDEFMRHFMMGTLEGSQQLDSGSIVCIGLEAKDMWQQDPNKLFAKYNVIGVRESGWFIAEPKADNAVYAVQIIEESFAIEAQWGTEIDGTMYQFGHCYDYLLQNTGDLDDRWIVQEDFFKRTYEFVSQDPGESGVL